MNGVSCALRTWPRGKVQCHPPPGLTWPCSGATHLLWGHPFPSLMHMAAHKDTSKAAEAPTGPGWLAAERLVFGTGFQALSIPRSLNMETFSSDAAFCSAKHNLAFPLPHASICSSLQDFMMDGVFPLRACS